MFSVETILSLTSAEMQILHFFVLTKYLKTRADPLVNELGLVRFIIDEFLLAFNAKKTEDLHKHQVDDFLFLRRLSIRREVLVITLQPMNVC